MDKPKCAECGKEGKFLLVIFHPTEGKTLVCEDCFIV